MARAISRRSCSAACSWSCSFSMEAWRSGNPSGTRLRTTPSCGTRAEIRSEAPSWSCRWRRSRRCHRSRSARDGRGSGRVWKGSTSGPAAPGASPADAAGTDVMPGSSSVVIPTGRGALPTHRWGCHPHPVGARGRNTRGRDTGLAGPMRAMLGSATGTRSECRSPGGAVDHCLGVDLGTTFVAAAVAHDTNVEMFVLGDRSTVIPAAVFARDDGVLVTGDAAARRVVNNPDRVATEIKRRLGDPTPVLLGGRSYAVTDLLGALLQDVLARVGGERGESREEVVLTHPPNWGPYRRELFEDVPRFAGLSSALTVTEPEAAAAFYAATRRLPEGEIIAVYDLGGGTFDATVLQRTAEGLEILGSPEGIERLGGADFDEAVL